MRLAILGLSLLMVGCGGGGGDDDQSQPEAPAPVQAVAPVIWKPEAESSLSDANLAKSSLILAYHAINNAIQTSEQTFSKLNGLNAVEVPSTKATVACQQQGTVTVTMSQSLIISNSDIEFGQCGDQGVIANGRIIGERNAGGSDTYQVNVSLVSPPGDEKLYAKSRLIQHAKPTFFINGVTDELSFDLTTAGISTADGIDTGGSVIVKTTSPIQFVDSLATAPVGGEIMVTNTANRIWLVKVVQNGFEIYDPDNSTSIPLDYLSWYELTQ